MRIDDYMNFRKNLFRWVVILIGEVLTRTRYTRRKSLLIDRLTVIVEGSGNERLKI